MEKIGSRQSEMGQQAVAIGNREWVEALVQEAWDREAIFTGVGPVPKGRKSIKATNSHKLKS